MFLGRSPNLPKEADQYKLKTYILIPNIVSIYIKRRRYKTLLVLVKGDSEL